MEESASRCQSNNSDHHFLSGEYLMKLAAKKKTGN